MNTGNDNKLRSNVSVYLSEPILKSLSRNGLDSIKEFLNENAEKVSKITNLTLPQVLDVRSNILTKYSAPITNGADLLDKLLNKRHLATGIPSLDTTLQGGLPVRVISEICGLAGSGKSQLCLQIAINIAKNPSSSVLYISTKGDFSAIRVQKILDAHGYGHKEMAEIMSRINIVHIWTMEAAIALFERLCSKTLVIPDLKLIIIDSLPSLMFQYLGDECKIGLSLLNKLTNKIHHLCRSDNICLICVNVQSRWIDHEIVDLEDDDDLSVNKETKVEKKYRCLGKYWQHIPALVVQIEKLPTKTNASLVTDIVATVVKSNCSELYGSCNMTLNNSGLT